MYIYIYIYIIYIYMYVCINKQCYMLSYCLKHRKNAEKKNQKVVKTKN